MTDMTDLGGAPATTETPAGGEQLGQGVPATPATPEAPAAAQGEQQLQYDHVDLENQPKLGETPNQPAQMSDEEFLASVPEDGIYLIPTDGELTQEEVNAAMPYMQAAKEAGLTQQQFQKLYSTMGEVMQNQVGEHLEMQSQSWQQESFNDPDIGKENFTKSIELGTQALKRFGTDALINVLNESGLGNHPEVIRVFRNIGRAMGDDNSIVRGSNGVRQSQAGIASTNAGLGEALYN